MASATCAPPRATARSTRSTVRCAPRSARSTRTSKDIELVNFKVRILDENEGHRRRHARAARQHLRRPIDSWVPIGVNENIIAASWEALVDSLEYAEQPARTRARTPLAKPVIGAREEELVLEALALRPALARAEGARLRTGVRGPRRCGACVRGLVRDDRAASGTAGGRRVRGRRGRDVAVLVRRLRPTASSSRARGRSLPTSRPHPHHTRLPGLAQGGVDAVRPPDREHVDGVPAAHVDDVLREQVGSQVAPVARDERQVRRTRPVGREGGVEADDVGVGVARGGGHEADRRQRDPGQREDEVVERRVAARAPKPPPPMAHR